MADTPNNELLFCKWKHTYTSGKKKSRRSVCDLFISAYFAVRTSHIQFFFHRIHCLYVCIDLSNHGFKSLWITRNIQYKKKAWTAYLFDHQFILQLSFKPIIILMVFLVFDWIIFFIVITRVFALVRFIGINQSCFIVIELVSFYYYYLELYFFCSIIVYEQFTHFYYSNL